METGHVTARLPEATPLRRFLLASVLGTLVGVYCYRRLERLPYAAHDFTYAWFAARALLDHGNPYVLAHTASELPFSHHFHYPLTAALAALPFCWLPVHAAGGAFFGVATAVFSFTITREGWWRLGMLALAPFTVATWSVQWSPLLIAAALSSPLGWLLAAKPNVGAIAWMYRPRWETAVGAGAFVLMSLVVMPAWPRDWIDAVRAAPNHTSPLFWWGGFIGLLALLRWRTPEGRLLAMLTVTPAVPWFYDQLAVGLVARSFRELVFLTVCSWAGFILALARYGMTFEPGMRNMQPYVVLGTIAPALLLVLIPRRRSEPKAPTSAAETGDVPSRMDERSTHAG